MDTRRRHAQYPAMARVITLLVLALPLAACGSDPRSYGITGPGATPLPPPTDNAPDLSGPENSALPMGTPDSTIGNSRYWRYNLCLSASAPTGMRAVML